MAEDWEDWENDDFTPQLPAATAQPVAADEEDVAAAKFAGEDEEEEKPQYNVPKPQQVSKLPCLTSIAVLADDVNLSQHTLSDLAG